MTTFFQAHLGDEEGVSRPQESPNHGRPCGARGHQAHAGERPDISKLAFSLCVFLSVCGFFRLCFCLASSVSLCVCVDGLISRLVVAASPLCEVAAKKPGVQCSAGRQPGWRWQQQLLLAWLTKYVPVGTRKARKKGALRGKSKAGDDQPVKQSSGRGKCPSQKCSLREQRKKKNMQRLEVNASFCIKETCNSMVRMRNGVWGPSGHL